jgi:hypothetical protein
LKLSCWTSYFVFLIHVSCRRCVRSLHSIRL